MENDEVVMKVRVLMGVFLIGVALAGTAAAQVLPPPNPRNPDEPLPTGTIEGRVFLPSGHSINSNVKVILSNRQNPLYTLYTNKHGEFRFTEMKEGIYYLEVVADSKVYDPVMREVWLKRGEELNLTIYLSTKRDELIRTITAKTVSVAELNRNIPAAARREYGRAQERIREGDVLTAIEHLRRAIARHPDYLIARNDLGVQYLKLERFDEAAEQFRAAIGKSPSYFNPRLNLGLVLFEQRKYTEAREQFRQAVSLDSARPAAHLWLGVTLIETGDLDQAERELVRARALGGAGYALAHYYVAQVYLKRDQPEAALHELTTYLEEAPQGEKAEEARLLIERLRR